MVWVLAATAAGGFSPRGVQDPFQPPTTCEAPAELAKSNIGFPEARAHASDGPVWALFFPRPDAPRELKIVWRVTGAGAFAVRAYKPSGATLSPDWGPVPHEGSNWDRPGDEWGTGFVFPAAGCWDLHVTRGQASGDLWIEVKEEERASIPPAVYRASGGAD